MSTEVSYLPYPMDVHTPRGPGKAWLMIDYGPDHHAVWGVIMKDTGESWFVRNPDVRFAWCETNQTGRKPDMPLPWEERAKPTTHAEWAAGIVRTAQTAIDPSMLPQNTTAPAMNQSTADEAAGAYAQLHARVYGCSARACVHPEICKEHGKCTFFRPAEVGLEPAPFIRCRHCQTGLTCIGKGYCCNPAVTGKG